MAMYKYVARRNLSGPGDETQEVGLRAQLFMFRFVTLSILVTYAIVGLYFLSPGAR
ncbi:hypothetical protein [Angustibacter luteus]|uniref:DUF1467 family protein n=1 Tax=Angustibacter luteus TaxID=658456 RepID=A0ABW1JFR9_9ACTN